MMSSNCEDQWIDIQHKTFVNWANDQLTLSNRSVENLATDLCDGVRLVALVETLQFQKIGKVYSNPKGRIQALHNVSVALKAVQNDKIKLVNIGTDDVVGGNLKLILGLLWRLILRYQISTSKSKAPPKKLMLSWFQDAIPDLRIGNFTSSWNDGVALHALLEYCKPGLSPKWRSLNPSDKVNNCKTAMQKAKEQLGVPRVISAEDFASPDLDELSAMTYLSYFIRMNSPGYYGTLNWVCRQLKTANISNLTTDWNDGFHLCSLVHSLGGEVEQWPNYDSNDHVGTCQRGLDAAEKLGISPILRASEMADPSVDHLAIMAYISKLQRVVPRKRKSEKLSLDISDSGSRITDEKMQFTVSPEDPDVEPSKVQIHVVGPEGRMPSEVSWSNNKANCTFTPHTPGSYHIEMKYDGVGITGSPFEIKVVNDYRKVKVTGILKTCPISQSFYIQVEAPFPIKRARVKLKNDTEGETEIFMDEKDSLHTSRFQPRSTGLWTVQVLVDDIKIEPITFNAYDVSKAKISGSHKGIVDQPASLKVETQGCGCDELKCRVETEAKDRPIDATVKTEGFDHHISFTPTLHNTYYVQVSMHDEQIPGSPFCVDVVDPMRMTAIGDGLVQAIVGMEAFFRVNTAGFHGNINATVDVENYQIPVTRERLDQDIYEFSYIPVKAGLYNVNVLWNETAVKGSPFRAKIIDKSQIRLLGDITELTDENNHLALMYGSLVGLSFDLCKAGPGKMTAEMLTPNGKIPLHVEQTGGQATVSIVAEDEGAHHIHIFWGDSPLDASPYLAYCPGPPLPVDSTMVFLEGKGKEAARTAIPAEFVINGRKAGPGVPKVVLKALSSDLPVEMKPMKYDRYRCGYTPGMPGGYLLYVYWSDDLVPGCPSKVNVTPKGDPAKVKVQGEGLHGGFVGQELYGYVLTSEAGAGDVTATCESQHQTVTCQVWENRPGENVVCFCPLLAEKHSLAIKYDGDHVTGSPFTISISEPPNPQKVHVFGPGVEDGLIDSFESRFLVDTHGAGTGQLSVKIKGPRGGFRVDMARESRAERIITCRYDPSESGEYFIQVRWSGVHVPGSPFHVQLVDTQEELDKVLHGKGRAPKSSNDTWRGDI